MKRIIITLTIVATLILTGCVADANTTSNPCTEALTTVDKAMAQFSALVTQHLDDESVAWSNTRSSSALNTYTEQLITFQNDVTELTERIASEDYISNRDQCLS